MRSLSAPHARADSSPQAEGSTHQSTARAAQLSPEAAQRIVMALMVPSMLMPIASGMSRVALPIIRNDFGLTADMTAWVATSYTLPFLILMPVYGRLSDGVGRRRLLLVGMCIFAVGTALTLSTTSLAWLMVGRAIQGIGTAGITPLGMAIISAIFRAEERGKALGTWSSIGPTAAAIAPPTAGLLVDWGGWRLAFAPPLLLAVIAILVVAKVVPAGLSTVQPTFWRRFDWSGALLLGGAITFLLFYLSSRPITGAEPLYDWRLLGITLLLLTVFLWWEGRRHAPFVPLGIFTNRMFTTASCAAALRMITMAAGSFLVPLFLVDIYQMRATTLGFMLMIMPGAMMMMVRFGGMLADRWDSRWPVMIGFVAQIATMLLFSQVMETTPLWLIGAFLVLHGLGVGLMLAALHRAAIQDVGEQQVGVAAGLYSMLRFVGMATGTALSGVILQSYTDQGLPLLNAYQASFRVFAFSALLGLLVALIGFRTGNQLTQ
ncbi:MAG TPA: MFS transporter [Caldilineaceae bacterium]|nr:MFS transporter [Caldilineaceae bacterium]